MSNFILLGFSFFAGILLRRFKQLPTDAPATLNRFILFLSLPAMILVQLRNLTFSTAMILPISMAWLLFGLSAAYVWMLSRFFRIDKKSRGTLILLAGLGNTSFIGYPLLESFYGPEALKIGILNDQFGSFFVLATLGLCVATSSASTREVTLHEIGRRMFSFPPLYALLLGLATQSIRFPDEILQALGKIAATLSPLALVSVGFQLRLDWESLRRKGRLLAHGLFFKLAGGPLVLYFIYVGIFNDFSFATRVTLIESAMAPMITAAVLVAEYEMDVELANLMVGLGIPLSFLTVPTIFYLVR